MITVYNKLIRDKLVTRMKEKGLKPITRILDSNQYKAALLSKLVEEADEARSGPAQNLSAEIGDLLDVIDAVILEFDLDRASIDDARRLKTQTRGGFSGKVFLESIDEE